MIWTDKIQHALLCFAITFVATFGYNSSTSALFGAVVGVTIEAVQIEAYWRRYKSLKGYWWSDTIIDLIADGIGIGLALWLRGVL